MKRIPFILFLLLIAYSCFSQTRVMNAKVKYHTEKAQNYLDREKALSGYYSIDNNGIRMFASPKDKAAGKAEFVIRWDQIENFNELKASYSSKGLFELYRQNIFQSLPPGENLKALRRPQGIKIAIDPGHIANDFITGDLEKKHIKIKADSINGIKDSIEIAEGILTFATAKILKEKLEKEGAIVFLTRTADKTAFGKTFEQWKKDDLKAAVDSLYKIGELKSSQKQYFLSTKANDRDIFRVIFRDLELAKRAELINNFNPDLTVVIHFNVDETNKDWEKCSNRNFNMCFVAGAFMKNDLSKMEKRFEFLRLLITDDLEKSITLSSSVLSSFEKTLNVRTATQRDANYLMEGCLPSGANGVYCRNLQLPRYIHSPVVYGETLYQDNVEECKMLNCETDKTKNKRIQQVADAYYNGIMNYLNSAK